jgi:putative transposase
VEAKSIRHDTKHNRFRLSKGANHKDHPRDWDYILVEYEVRDDAEVENIQQVRAAYDSPKEQWELHLVCKHEIETPESPGDETAGIDLGICNFAAVAYSAEQADLYPGNRLKQDGYYFPKEIAKCDDSGVERATRLHHRWSERRTHFFHGLAKHIVERCGERGVDYINIGELSGIREDGNGDAKNWGNMETSTCTGGRSTDSPTSLKTKRRSRASRSEKYLSGTRVRRVVFAVEKMKVSVMNVACTSARIVMQRSTLT